ncbi:hypothetical protein B0T10DRAFT_578175 [Thelonectria olida]|uniref:Uncharacterized protein n=1 Tax=Thelonectria olida TaxID=1576542 RepID=A0A9P9AY59_9HYPO|nr:hypothetical protein B0T10DRAFT_578175 [Thelonectria olida]
MAAQAMIAHGPDVRQGAATPTSMSYRPMAGSPTLTNPDMILPDYDYDRAASPSDERSRSPVMLWNNPQIANMPFQLPPSQISYMAGNTPIIYGNGTMLSDIGEVTEVESVVGRGSRRPSSHLSLMSDDATALRSSPTIGVPPRFKNKTQLVPRERRSSLESTSTVTTQGQNGGEFADFDDAVSVDDINFQGDDEESMASSYVEGTPAQEPSATKKPERQPAPEDRFSTSSLSDRAEQILANAKKRLSTMEGNLSRARNTVSYTPMSDGSTPSPPIARAATSFRDSTGLGGHSRMSSETSFQNDLTHPGYPLRSASALGAAGGYRQPLTSSRSADALGGYSGYGPRMPPHPLDLALEPLSEDEDHMDADQIGNQSGHLRTPTFGSITDKEVTRSVSVTQVRDLKDQMKDLKGKISSLKEQARADSLKRRSLQSLRTPSPFTHARWDQGFMEARGIRGANQDTVAWQAPWNTGAVPNDFEVDKPIPNYEELAAAELKAEEEERAFPEEKEAFEDEAKEESIDGSDSTRTEHALEYRKLVEQVGKEQEKPSPEEDDQPLDEFVTPGEEPGEWKEDAALDEQVQLQEEEVPELEAQELEQEQQQELELDEAVEQLNDEEQEEEEEDEDEEQEFAVEDDDEGDDEEGEFVDFDSESGESLYHDTFQHPISHEDREDAFDYEHFFLHSAMGTISQQRLERERRGSFGSVSSEESVETTRGPIVDLPRRSSIDTMSSVNSFATATEGRLSRTSTMGDNTKETAVSTPESSDYSDGPPTSKRTTFGGFDFARPEEESDEPKQDQPRRNTVVHRPAHSESVSSLRPSVSSFESTGTNRSFPLVSKAKVNGGVLTPSGSPDRELDQISETLMNETASICEQESGGGEGQTPALHLLSKEDQVLVQKLVASLGKCVLGLTEVSKASVESRMYRRRLESARRILEGLEE